MLARHTYFDQETRTRIIDYSMEVGGLKAPDEVLNRLHNIVSERNPIRVLGANRFSVKLLSINNRMKGGALWLLGKPMWILSPFIQC